MGQPKKAETSMGKKTIVNLFWRFAERCGAQSVSFIVSIVLARILSPEDYGTVALITVFTTIFQVFVDSGLGTALIQKKDADEIDFSTVFYANMCFCVVLYLLIFMASPQIAAFYGDLKMTAYIRVLALTVVISGLKNVQQAYVSRHLIFKKFFFSTLGGTIFAGVVGVAMALNGFGVWALVAQHVINLTIDTTILWITVKWHPTRAFSLTRLKKLYTFGWKILASSLLDTVYNNMRQLVIGKMYSSADLAFFNKAKQFPNLIITNINTSIDSVLLPTMCNVQENNEKVRSIMRRSIKTSIYLMSPLMMGLAFTGDTVIRLILTDKWLPCVFFLRIFCITYMFYPIHTANLNAIKAMGRSDLFLKLEVEKKVVGVLLLLATMWISVKAMAYSLLLNSLAAQMINASPNKKLLGYSYIDQIKDILPSILLAVFMGICVYPLEWLGLPSVLTLVLQILLGAIIYLGASAWFKIEEFQYLLKMVKPILSRKK